jgi:hypothetical protein
MTKSTLNVTLKAMPADAKVLMEFYATWCPACRSLLMLLQQLQVVFKPQHTYSSILASYYTPTFQQQRQQQPSMAALSGCESLQHAAQQHAAAQHLQDTAGYICSSGNILYDQKTYACSNTARTAVIQTLASMQQRCSKRCM